MSAKLPQPAAHSHISAAALDHLNSSNNHNNVNSRPASAGYYHPFQQPQPQHPAQQRDLNRAPDLVDGQTLSNTLANAHLHPPTHQDHLHAARNRQPRFTEEWDASVRGSSIIDGPSSQYPTHHSMSPTMQRSSSVASRRSDVITNDGASSQGIALSRGNTLKKKNSLRKSSSLRRSGSRRSMKAGSVRSLALQSAHDTDEIHSAFFCPVPTSGNPTEVLANRFQSWRKVLKDLIAYFREIQSYYEHRSKSLLKLANVLNNISTPPGFLASGGLDDALQILRTHHKTAIAEANKAREIEEDVILALTGLRSDLNQKIKEIKSLHSDFKNSVEKEMDGTRKAVNALQEVLGQNEMDSSLTTGKQDPYLLRLAVDRQVDRQLYEENYLHQAYLNLENSGRELESIVVGEIQKSYNAYAGILKRESDAAYNAIDELRVGPIAMPKDHEWTTFIQRDSQFVDPDMPVRSPDRIHYPGRDHFACQEIRAGLLERKSKYLKSYTAGWYVLSATHLHEFKSADKTQAPVMSLYLPEQKLGSHSSEGGSSNKFILKGRQTGTMHRGHTWVFRAESHDTMMAWYEDIKALTEKTPEELNSFVRGHSRTYSRSSQRSISSDGMVDDDDEEPFSADPAVSSPGSRQGSLSNRPEPGGRFPSDLQVNAQRGLQVPRSPSSTGSGFVGNDYTMRGASSNSNQDHDVIAAAGALPGSGYGETYLGDRSLHVPGQTYGDTSSVRMDQAPSHAAMIDHHAREDGINPYNGEPIQPGSQGPPQFANVAPNATGPGVAHSVHTTGTSTSGMSEDSGIPYPYQSQPGEADIGAQTNEMAQASNGNGGMKAMPGAAAEVPFVPQTQNVQVRPPGERTISTNSTPHVPGEYPRSLASGTVGHA
ncbi:hypothetical protein F4780DRAFT_41641 [Xylariomycetidae sp. FL0641]|nr:hypothetical protein F4780DRAFT_41641 [Xylariomycetidae sp. FL0641]